MQRLHLFSRQASTMTDVKTFARHLVFHRWNLPTLVHVLYPWLPLACLPQGLLFLPSLSSPTWHLWIAAYLLLQPAYACWKDLSLHVTVSSPPGVCLLPASSWLTPTNHLKISEGKTCGAVPHPPGPVVPFLSPHRFKCSPEASCLTTSAVSMCRAAEF